MSIPSTSLRKVVIVSAARTPVGKFNGVLSTKTAPELGSVAIQHAMKLADIDASVVEEAVMGNVVSSSIGQAPCRQAVLGAGLSESTVCTTVNKVCASGMKAVQMAYQSIAMGYRDTVIAGGMESMSNVPYYMSKGRNGYKYGHGVVEDGILKDGLWDKYNDIHMGNCAEKTAKEFAMTREEQDSFAISSYEKAIKAEAAGAFAKEIAPVTIKGKRGKPDVVVDKDEGYTNVNYEKLKALKPAFDKQGTITAGNASPLNDGAAALVLMSEELALKLGKKPLARIIAYGDAEVAPIDFSVSPTHAAYVAMKNAGIQKQHIKFWEINEAFSAVSLANIKLLDLDQAFVNVNGGAVAIGHPIGASGARITGHLASIVAGTGEKGVKGLASICNGGGGGSAIVVESM